MTAEAIHWRSKYSHDTLVFPLERFYSMEEQNNISYLAKQNEDVQDDINKAWCFLVEEDKIKLELMLTAWAKRDRGRNKTVYTWSPPPNSQRGTSLLMSTSMVRWE